MYKTLTRSLDYMWAGNCGIRNQSKAFPAQSCAIVCKNRTIRIAQPSMKNERFDAPMARHPGIPLLNDSGRPPSRIACDYENRWTIYQLPSAVRNRFWMESLGIPDDFVLARLQHDSQVPASCGIACFFRTICFGTLVFHCFPIKRAWYSRRFADRGARRAVTGDQFSAQSLVFINDSTAPRNSCVLLEMV